MADEIRSELSFEAREAINTLQRMASELVQYNRAVTDAASGTSTFNTSGTKFDTQAAKIAKTLDRLSTAAASAASKLNQIQASTRAFNASNAQAAAEAQLQQLRTARSTAQALGNVAEARRLDNQIAQAELKTQLRLNAAAREQAAARRASADPLGRAGPTGQGSIEATVTRIRNGQREAEASQQRLRSEARQTEIALRNSFRGGAEGAKSLGTELKKTGEEGAKAGRTVLLSWESVVRIFAIQTIHRAVSLVTSAFADGIGSAVEYQTALAEIQTIGDDLDLTLGDVDDRVRAIADAFGQPLEAVAEGLYETLSNQVGEAADSFQFLENANRFATAAVTDTDNAVNLLSSAINSFNFDVSDTDIIAAKFFRTIDLGRVRAEELANTFGRVGVLSNQLGVSFDETLASIASLTVQGLRFNEAFTLITNTQLKLIRPTDKLKDVFNELGVASAEAGIQAFGFQGFLEQLTEASGGTATEIGELFNRVRAIRGALGLTGVEGERFRDALQQIQEAGSETLNEAFGKVFETDAARFKRELGALRSFFVADFGQDAIAVLVRLGDVFGGLADVVQSIALGFGVATASLAAFYAATAIAAFNMGTLAASIQFAALNLAAFVATPVGAFLAIAAGVTAVAIAYDGLTESVREANEARIREGEAASRTEQRLLRQRRRELAGTENEILGDIQRFLQQRQAAFRDDARIALQIQTQLLGDIQSQVENRVSTVESFVKRLENSVRGANESLRELNGELQQVGDDLERFNFERSIRGLSSQQQITAQIQRSQEAINALSDAIASNDTERARRLAEIAESSANAALSTADQAGNTSLVRRAEEQVRDAIRARADIVRDQISDRREEARVADELLSQETARLTRVRQISDEIQKLEAISDGLEVSPDFTPDEAKQEAQQLTRALEAELQGAADSALLLRGLSVDFESIRQDLIQKFREPLTGVEIDLTDAVQINLERIIQRLSQQASQLSSAQTRALGGLGVDTEDFFRGFGDAQKLLTEIPKELNRATDATQSLITQTQEFNQAVIETDTAIAELGTQLLAVERRGALVGLVGDFEGVGSGLVDFFGRAGEGVRSLIGGTDSAREGARGLNQEIVELRRNFDAALQAGDAQGVNRAIAGIDQIANQLSEGGLNNLAERVAGISAALDSIAEQAFTIRISEDAAASLKPLEEQILRSGDAFQDLGRASAASGAEAVRSNSRAINSQNNLTRAIQNSTAAELEFQRLRQGGNPQARQFGGLLFRQSGGLAFDRRQFGGQRGTDSIPTLLTAGESVNDVASTRRFFPQIQAMNAGVIPSFQQPSDGGTTNIGDFNINVNSGSTDRDTARVIMQEIKRELRRKTFNLRRP